MTEVTDLTKIFHDKMSSIYGEVKRLFFGVIGNGKVDSLVVRIFFCNL